jgi:Concanavalin A-like lectin/glucanases superfamily
MLQSRFWPVLVHTSVFACRGDGQKMAATRATEVQPVSRFAAVFHADQSTGLSWTPTDDGDSTQKASISLWYQVGHDTGGYQHLFSARSPDATAAQQIWLHEGKIGVLSRVLSDNGFWVETKQANLGQPGQWHHLLAHFDLSKSSAAAALTVWIDGAGAPTDVQAEHPHTEFRALFAKGNTHYIGISGTTEPFDGQLRQLHVLDGILAPIESFFQKGQPVSFSGDHGRNGFRLDFSDAANLGADQSNHHDFGNSGVTQKAVSQ